MIRQSKTIDGNLRLEIEDDFLYLRKFGVNIRAFKLTCLYKPEDIIKIQFIGMQKDKVIRLLCVGYPEYELRKNNGWRITQKGGKAINAWKQEELIELKRNAESAMQSRQNIRY